MKNLILIAIFGAAALTLGACKNNCCQKAACCATPVAASYGK